jgi:hypothetical protein
MRLLTFRFLIRIGVGMAALAVSGCNIGTPGCTLLADPAVQPVIAAIEAYKAKHGQLPASLKDVQAEQDPAKPLVLSQSTESGLVWSINYERPGPGVYGVSFDHVHCRVYYENGHKAYSGNNPFR